MGSSTFLETCDLAMLNGVDGRGLSMFQDLFNGESKLADFIAHRTPLLSTTQRICHQSITRRNRVGVAHRVLGPGTQG